MTCKAYKDRLYLFEDYLDSRLDAATHRELSLHLEVCATCRHTVEDAALAGRLLRAALEPAQEASGAFWTRLRAEVGSEEQRLLSGGDFWNALELLARRFAWSAGVALVLMSAYLIGSGLLVQERGANQNAQQNEVREIFPEPEQQPTSRDEVLLTLANREKAR